MEKKILDWWYKEGIVEKYLHRNDDSKKKFSFLDGPITANNPMGVHHGWGRTYKDLWQRFYNMKGFAERFQNGFDEQGLWVEVNVEKDLGLKSKKDILNLIPGNKFASLEKFVNLCKERVVKYAEIQTEQSKRLGYFMDWKKSYHTSSANNNYAIWNFLKVVNEKGWLYKGHDSVPWCPRCGTAISQHEILTEEYQELVHQSIFFKLPLKDDPNKYLLVWTTTPWTIPLNVAVAVNPDEEYVEYPIDGEIVIVMQKTIDRLKKEGILPLNGDILTPFSGSELVGKEYEAPFDAFLRVKESLRSYHHRVVVGVDQILLVSDEEGTGLVHVAPGAGAEDFQLGKREDLPVIEGIDEEANYLDGLGELSGKNAKIVPELVINFLKEKDKGKFLFLVREYKHRYPTCWRCKTELVWRVVDEWYIAMDKHDESKKTYREQMTEVAKKLNWLPSWGLDRELDWLKNMHDWLISKKRFWGLSLPIWECSKCGTFEVIGSLEELQEKAVSGFDEVVSHSPHRPWIDLVKIKCSSCNEIVSRIPDVGNPWLDAGIVPFSTLPTEWFPSDFVTESFPGQFKNWFYALIAMSTALTKTNPMKNLLGFASVRDEKGEEMHKSKGNAIEFNEAADKIGVDVMRWLYATQNPEYNLNFGFKIADEVRRKFYLILWNSYKFFADYASLNEWECEMTPNAIKDKLTVLDRWILSRLTSLTLLVNESLERYDAMMASRAIESFVVNDFSTWYIRRSRERVGAAADTETKNIFFATSYGVLVTLSKLLAPFVPFISEEIFKNLTGELSVHLQDYPLGDKSLLDELLMQQMDEIRLLSEIGHAKRKEAGIKLRQPLASFTYTSPQQLTSQLEEILKAELNVKKVVYKNGDVIDGKIDTVLTKELEMEGEVRELIRLIQQKRKELGLTLKDRVRVIVPSQFERNLLLEELKKETQTADISFGDNLEVEKLNE